MTLTIPTGNVAAVAGSFASGRPAVGPGRRGCLAGVVRAHCRPGASAALAAEPSRIREVLVGAVDLRSGGRP
ncbi:MAG TPA: hypothetical protein VGO78_24525 [Acidimicrobiales bacterium]|jgi:hypothetical protein|nr:hypothetical protein [Acidimicrobiales bacterium]